MTNNNRESQSLIVGMCLVSVIMVSCATDQGVQMGGEGPSRVDTPIQAVEGVPDWVFQKGAAFSGERRVFYGVGNAVAIQNSALRRRSAEAAARRDILQGVKVFVAGLNKQYMAETTAGARDKVSVEQHIEDVMKQVTSGTLVGSSIVEYWEHPSKNESYALARVDLEQFQDVMKNYASAETQYKELDAKVREFVKKNAAKAHDELTQELKGK
jgi:hypothetical protein